MSSAKVPQSWVATISTALVFAFRSSLGSALLIAFTQQIWKLFRHKPLKGTFPALILLLTRLTPIVSTIDLLYTVLSSPVNLFYPELAISAPLEFLFALVFWSLPIATIFPPGALVIAPETRITLRNATVPTFNPNYSLPVTPATTTDTSSETTLFPYRAQALYWLSDHGDYRFPISSLTSRVKQTILAGKYLTPRLSVRRKL